MKRQLTMPYVPAAKRIRANNVLARSMRRYKLAKSRRGSFPRPTFSGPELKNNDKAVAAINPAFDVALLYSVFEPTAGTGSTQMIGRRCHIKSFQIAYNIRLAAGSVVPTTWTHQPETVRVMVIYDSDPDGTVPVVTDVLQTNLVTSPLKLENNERFRILIDRYHEMGAVNITTTQVLTIGNGVASNREYRKLNLGFEGPSTSGILGIKSGAIYVLFISTALDASGNAFCDFYARTRFVDA